RDISVMFFAHPDLKMRKALDAMSATGARAVRIMNEARPKVEFHINDWDSSAADIIQRNIELNGLENCVAINQDLRCLLASERYDYIDLDPFGTPVPFLAPAIQGLKRNGILAVTATDTAPLAGTHAKKCVRRYQARPLRCLFGHEIGLRILIGYVARQAAMFDKGTEPLLCFYADHFMRLYLRMRESADAADASLKNMGYLRFEKDSHERTVLEHCEPGAIGPLWVGPIKNDEFISGIKMMDSVQEKNRCQKYLDLWKDELPIPYFFENNELASDMHSSPVRLERLIEGLQTLGMASKTHFSPTGFKSDQPYSVIRAHYDSFR
ncbi:MAG TPA: N2,N2-dimethylguanosine tRNA methyltransferase, partial [Methanomassiliicoccales archaeon]|nr:N2,N2-dimethylguanosine tRNA methyltransferase [Methanomassiliicoccales archaeon]